MVNRFCFFLAISLYTTTLKKHENHAEDSLYTKSIDFKDKSSWYLDVDILTHESIVRQFIWAQWDPVVQALYYIHMKISNRNLLEKDEKDKGLSPTLSAYQFHDDLPTETVVCTILYTIYIYSFIQNSINTVIFFS